MDFDGVTGQIYGLGLDIVGQSFNVSGRWQAEREGSVAARTRRRRAKRMRRWQAERAHNSATAPRPCVTSRLQRTIVSMNPTTLAITTLGVVPSFGVESGGICTVDQANGILYWIGMPVPFAPNDPLYLIGNSIKDGSVVTSALLCADDAVCPWSLEFRN